MTVLSLLKTLPPPEEASNGHWQLATDHIDLFLKVLMAMLMGEPSPRSTADHGKNSHHQDNSHHIYHCSLRA